MFYNLLCCENETIIVNNKPKSKGRLIELNSSTPRNNAK